MKKVLAVAALALGTATPAQAISIVSLHGGGAPGGGMLFSLDSVDGTIALGGLLALAAVVSLRVLRRSAKAQ